jgi:hypothetical protein
VGKGTGVGEVGGILNPGENTTVIEKYIKIVINQPVDIVLVEDFE